MKHLFCILISIYSIEKSTKQRLELCNPVKEGCVNIIFDSLEDLEKNNSKLDSVLNHLKEEWCEYVY
jgi:hypothetical protein